VHDSRGIEIVNFTISLALSAGTLMASAGTPYRLVPAHFYPCSCSRDMPGSVVVLALDWRLRRSRVHFPVVPLSSGMRSRRTNSSVNSPSAVNGAQNSTSVRFMCCERSFAFRSVNDSLAITNFAKLGLYSDELNIFLIVGLSAM